MCSRIDSYIIEGEEVIYMLSCFCVRNSEEDVLYVGVNGGFLGICFGVERRMKPICGCNYIMDFKFSVCYIHYNTIFS